MEHGEPISAPDHLLVIPRETKEDETGNEQKEVEVEEEEKDGGRRKLLRLPGRKHVETGLVKKEGKRGIFRKNKK